MQAITTHTGRAVPLRRSDVDTDQIIPSDWLKRVERTGFGAGLFGEWRADPGFVLEQPQYAGASVLVTGENFGTGSSREHAVWALQDYGFAAVVSPRFGDIFRNNALKGGLVPVQLTAQEVEVLWAMVEADPIDDFTRWRLMEGLDDIGLTLRHESDIAAYEGRRPAFLPTTTARG